MIKPSHSITLSKHLVTRKNVKSTPKCLVSRQIIKNKQNIHENKRELSNYDSLSYCVKKNPSQEKKKVFNVSSVKISNLTKKKENPHNSFKACSTNKLIEKMMNLNLRSKWTALNNNTNGSQSLSNILTQNNQ